MTLPTAVSAYQQWYAAHHHGGIRRVWRPNDDFSCDAEAQAPSLSWVQSRVRAPIAVASRRHTKP